MWFFKRKLKGQCHYCKGFYHVKKINDPFLLKVFGQKVRRLVCEECRTGHRTRGGNDDRK